MLWIWLCGAVGLIVTELFTGELTALMLALGASAALAAYGLGLDLYWQIAICALSSLLSLWLLKPVLYGWMQPEVTELSTEGFIGQDAQVLEAIAPGQRGRVKIHGEIWFATAYEAIPAGEPVTIVQIRNNCLEVISQAHLRPSIEAGPEPSPPPTAQPLVLPSQSTEGES